jgi:uncharacterized protein YqeY
MDWMLALSVLEQGLKLWNNKEGRKYLDRVIKIRTEYAKEFNRPDRSDLALDRLLDEYRIIARSFTEGAIGNDAASSSK